MHTKQDSTLETSKIKYIISGTGRSGTTLIHKLLLHFGSDIGTHEIESGVDGGVGGFRVLPLLLNTPNYKVVIQMRDPVETINSVLTSSPSDFPNLGLYKKDYNNMGLYVLNAWYKIHTELMRKNYLFGYTLKSLNEGKISEKLIKLYNLKCTEEEFNIKLKYYLTTRSRNARPKKSNITLDELKKLDSSLVEKSYNLYNTINNAN